MATVDLVYDSNCPNVEAARSQLLNAFFMLGMKPHWKEWEINNPDTPDEMKHFGSPAILINGKDISGSANDVIANNCRVYTNSEGTISGAPSADQIVSALQHEGSKRFRTFLFDSHGLNLAMFPAIGLALLPKLVCPLCWPLYTSLLGIIGLDFINYTPYLLPLLVVFLTVTNIILALAAIRKNAYGPVILGFVSSLSIIVGKFMYESLVLSNVGMAGLIAAVVWHAWPGRYAGKEKCPSCMADKSTQ